MAARKSVETGQSRTTRDLPDIGNEEFARLLRTSTTHTLSDDVVGRLWLHYEELRRWNRRLSLVGPGAIEELITRHYAESLAVLELLDPTDRTAVDLGSGAGFPGWILAAARPDMVITLVEARQRKWSFLSQISEKAALPCRCLNARVTAALPEGFPPQVDLVLSRAVRLGKQEFSALGSALGEKGRFLLWSSKPPTEKPDDFEVARRLSIEGSRNRQIVELVRRDPRSAA